jgi:tetratricopeptide (TPR) repeat protein
MREKQTRSKRQLIDEARRAGLDGRWDEAVELNQQLISRSPKDADAQNRLGRSLLELGRYTPAIEAYTSALRSDPANMIARRNLQRLELLRHRSQTPEPVSEVRGEAIPLPRTSVFIEEIGKTWVDELVNPAPMEQLVDVRSGQQLQLEVTDGRVFVAGGDGQRLGEIDAKTAERLTSLISAGNRFEVYALGITTLSLRVILREIFRDPSQGATFSFPRQIKSRAYLRERDILRQRDEADFFMLDDDDADDDDDEAVRETSEEDERSDTDTTSFVDDTVTIEEEEPTI